MVRNAILLSFTVILALLLSLQVTPPSSSQRKTEVEDEGDVVRERIEWFRKRHPQLDPKLRLKSVREEYQTREAIKKSPGLRQTAAATTWTSAGPSNGAGRINSIAVHPTTAGTVYIATNSGGVWKTTDNGNTWRNLTDSINNLNAGAIALAPSNPNIVYLGTGSEHAGGIGLLKSTDGGETWQFPSDVIAYRFFRISVHPTNALELVAASDRGALRSTDGGNTWTVGIPSNPYFQVTDVKRDPSNPLVLYASANTGEGARILKSTDGGISFTEKMAGLPAVLDPISLAITPSNPRVVYALTAVRPGGPVISHLFRSTDAAETWQDVTGFSLDSGTNRILGGQAWHDNTVVVSPSNANEITVGGISYRRSLDGGATWFVPFCDNASCISIHPDWTDQQYQGSTLWMANDGGIYSAQGNIAAAHNQGLPIREYYVMSNHPILANSFLAGSQDNGTDWRPPAGGTDLFLMPFCDGFDSIVNPQNPSLAYATCQSGHIRRTKEFGVNSNIYSSGTSAVISPAVQVSEGRPFATRLVMDQNQSSTLYTISQRHVWKTQDNGDSWTALPNTLSDGSTLDDLDNVAVAKSNSNVLIAWSQFDLFRSTDGGTTWSKRSPGDLINGADIDPTDANVMYVSSRSCFGCAGAFMSTDGGNTWSPRGNGLPASSGNLSIRVDPIDTNTLYCGTEKGVFTTSDRGQNWTMLGSGMPSIWVEDLRISKDGSILRAATYGRGIWEYQLRPSETANISGRVTDANGAGIQGATVTVGIQQNVITTTLTDQNGNYSFLKLARGFDYTLSAAKTGIQLTPSAITLPNLTTDQTANFTIVAAPTPTPTPTPFPIQLLTEDSGNTVDQLAVLDAASFMRDPFPVVNMLGPLLGGQTNRRVMIFASNLQLAQGDTSSAVVVNLIDSNNKSYDIPAEDVRPVPNCPFVQIIFRLPDNLPVGNCTVRVTVHGQLSNLGVFRIRI